MSKADPPALVAAAFRRSPARNRYVDAERWPVFTREQLGADDRVMVEAEGMVESQEWHRAPGKADYYDAAPSARGERAILIQSASHIAQLCEQFPELKEGLEEAGAFGENLLCAGERMDARNVHVGDVFSVEGSTLLLQAASPRRPCGNVDLRHGKRFGQQGVRAYCARTGCGGTFFRVLRAGAVGQGSRLRLEYTHSAQRRSHWSMARLSEVLYGEADSRYRVPRWRGSRAELRALCAEPALAEVEWKAVLLELLPRELRADGVAPLLRGVALAVWAALVATTFRAPAVRPDWLAWCGRLLAGDWAGEEMGLVVEFCMMGLWPLLIALQCAAVLGHRPARFCPPLGAFLLLSAGLGCFALAPGLALCADFAHAPAAALSTPSRPSSGARRLLRPALCAWGLGVGTVALLGLALAYAEPQRWLASVKAEGFAFIMTADFVAFWVLSIVVAYALDVAEMGRGKGLRWAWTLLPLLGVCGWVLARAGQELPGFIELWAAALNGWRRLRVKAKRKKQR